MEGLKNMSDKLELICEGIDCDDCPAYNICTPELYQKSIQELKVIKKLNNVDDLTLTEMETMLEIAGCIMTREDFKKYMESWEKDCEEERQLHRGFPY